MPQKRFGSHDSTGRKLDVIATYLEMYQKALSRTFETVYIDAFAGSGEIPIGETKSGLLDEDEEAKTVLVGSAVRAVAVDPPFSRYVFIDKREKCIRALRQRLEDNENFARIEFQGGDANELVQAFCGRGEWRSRRGVVLLDPFGSQVAWATVEAVAATRALDLWYLFPAGLSVFRQISSDGRVDPTHAPSLTKIFGTDEWQAAFLKPSPQEDLFGGPRRQEKLVTAESAARFMMERMRGVFRGGVLDEMIPLGKHSYPSYYLLFAWGNDSPKAKALANKLSKAAIKATDRKYGRLV
jgi:three-Cys-motif partner protein